MTTDDDKVRSFLLAVDSGSEEDTTLELVYRLYQRAYAAEHALWRVQQDAEGLRWLLSGATVSQPPALAQEQTMTEDEALAVLTDSLKETP